MPVGAAARLSTAGGAASQPKQEIVGPVASRAALTNSARPICRKQTYPAWDGVCFPPLVSVFSLSGGPTFPAQALVHLCYLLGELTGLVRTV